MNQEIGPRDSPWDVQSRGWAPAPPGLGKYNDRNDAIEQLERDRRLRDAGFQVVHFTWKEPFGTPELVLSRIRKAIATTTPY